MAARWESQAEENLAQCERLKDLLEESAMWGARGGAGGGGDAALGVAGEGIPGLESTEEGARGGDAAAAAGAGAALQQRCEGLEREVLLEKARNAELATQVAALCAELTRASLAAGQVGADGRAYVYVGWGGMGRRLGAFASGHDSAGRMHCTPLL